MGTQADRGWQSADVVRWRPSPDGTLLVLVSGPLDPTTVSTIAPRVGRSVAQARTLVLGGAGLTAPDLTTVDLLARLLLIARRAGVQVRMQDASPRLHQLLKLVGIDHHLGITSSNP